MMALLSSDTFAHVLVYAASVLLALLAIATARVLYQLFVYPYHVSPLRHLPGPKDHHFLFGQHLNQFCSGSPEEPYTTWMRRWSTAPLIRYLELGHGDGLLLNSAVAYRDVMHTHCYAFLRSAPFHRLIGAIVGTGLVFAQGAEHRAPRRALGGFFSVAHVQNYLPVLRRKSQRLVREMQNACNDHDDMVEIKSLFARVTLDVVGVFALGLDLHTFDAYTDFQACYDTLFDLSPTGILLAAVNLIVPIRWLPLRENRTFVHASTRLRQILTKITSDRIQHLRDNKNASDDRAKDLLTYMIETQYNEDGTGWTFDDLVEQTTAGALTFAMHTLGLHPDVVRKLRAEADLSGLFGDNDDDAMADTSVSYADIDRLPYLDHVTKETLRLHPPVAGIPRVAVVDVVVGGPLVKKGTTLLPVPAVLHRNPAIWGDDVDEFRPERWEQPGGGALGGDVYAWTGFGHGPRACIGKAVALLSFKLVVLTLVRCFDFESIHKGRLPVINPSGQLRPSGDVWLRVWRARRGQVDE